MTISVAIPDSSLKDEKTLENKTRKIGLIARACSIFKINEIIIYRDGKENEHDGILLTTILRFLETPQYFRRQKFPYSNMLKFTGILPPLKIPNQTGTSNYKLFKPGTIREGLIIRTKGKKFIDLGIKKLIPYNGKDDVGKRIIIKINQIKPDFSIKEITKDQINDFWSYNVKQSGNLSSVLSNWNGLKILTSKNAKFWNKSLSEKIKDGKGPILVVFGTTDKGLHDILGKKIHEMQNSKLINFFPNQGTETVRLEEALLGVLGIINSNDIT